MVFTDIKDNKTGEPPHPQLAEDIGCLIPRKRVAEELGICPRSVFRRENDDPDFPQLIRINRRVYVRADEFRSYKRGLIRRGLCEAI